MPVSSISRFIFADSVLMKAANSTGVPGAARAPCASSVRLHRTLGPARGGRESTGSRLDDRHRDRRESNARRLHAGDVRSFGARGRAELVQEPSLRCGSDFSPITLVALAPTMLVAHPSAPAANLSEFLAYAKALARHDFVERGGPQGDGARNQPETRHTAMKEGISRLGWRLPSHSLLSSPPRTAASCACTRRAAR